jgi:hypothetical protein
MKRWLNLLVRAFSVILGPVLKFVHEPQVFGIVRLGRGQFIVEPNCIIVVRNSLPNTPDRGNTFDMLLLRRRPSRPDEFGIELPQGLHAPPVPIPCNRENYHVQDDHDYMSHSVRTSFLLRADGQLTGKSASGFPVLCSVMILD